MTLRKEIEIKEKLKELKSRRKSEPNLINEVAIAGSISALNWVLNKEENLWSIGVESLDGEQKPSYELGKLMSKEE